MVRQVKGDISESVIFDMRFKGLLEVNQIVRSQEISPGKVVLRSFFFFFSVRLKKFLT